MIDPQAKAKPYFRLMLLVAVMGVVSAFITWLFISIVNGLIAVLWDQAGDALGLEDWMFTLIVCTFGGLVVGLLVKLFGDHNAIFFELMQEFGKTGRFNYRNAPGILITALVSMVAGGSVGPEAPLADTCGGVGTLVSDKLKLNEVETRVMGFGGLSGMLAGFITNPGVFLGAFSEPDGICSCHSDIRITDRQFLRRPVRISPVLPEND